MVVVRPQVGVGGPHASQVCPQHTRCCPRGSSPDQGRAAVDDAPRRPKERSRHEVPVLPHPDSRVVDSREVDEGQVIRRRRSCQECGKRFTTVEEATLAVIKRSGVTEPFSRQKVVSGVRRACQGRPVDEDALAQLAQTRRRGGSRDRRRRGAQRRGRPGHPRPAARPRRGRLPALRLASTRRSARSTTSRRRSPTCAPSIEHVAYPPAASAAAAPDEVQPPHP